MDNDEVVQVQLQPLTRGRKRVHRRTSRQDVEELLCSQCQFRGNQGQLRWPFSRHPTHKPVINHSLTPLGPILPQAEPISHNTWHYEENHPINECDTVSEDADHNVDDEVIRTAQNNININIDDEIGGGDISDNNLMDEGENESGDDSDVEVQPSEDINNMGDGKSNSGQGEDLLVNDGDSNSESSDNGYLRRMELEQAIADDCSLEALLRSLVRLAGGLKKNPRLEQLYRIFSRFVLAS
ncbi:hypothetical protein HDU76_011652, partial [Blyttiomyces sp. JEL0837]